jgi:pilus assembly protein FimV
MNSKGLLAGALMLFPLQGAYALGLGDLRVESVLNQNLNARIELVSVRPGDIDNLNIRLADAEVFENAGLDRPHRLTQLKFEAVSTSESAGYIQITSKQRIREPFLNFIIEVEWPRGKMLREYTVLLESPG